MGAAGGRARSSFCQSGCVGDRLCWYCTRDHWRRHMVLTSTSAWAPPVLTMEIASWTLDTSSRAATVQATRARRKSRNYKPQRQVELHVSLCGPNEANVFCADGAVGTRDNGGGAVCSRGTCWKSCDKCQCALYPSSLL